MTQITNAPFNSNDAGKLFVFALLIVPPTILVVGVVPVLLLLFGVLMLRKSGDFSHIETATRNYWVFCMLAFLGLIGVATSQFLEYFNSADQWGTRSLHNSIEVAASSLIPLFYIAVMELLFLKPMRANRNWFARKFSAIREKSASGNAGEIDIIKGERLRSFSVADELLKWAKLKEDGHITEREFSEARRKLLERD